MSKLKHICHHIRRGCGYLPHCGSHPGTGWIFLFTIIGFAAGYDKGMLWGIGGSLLFLAFFSPLYIYGAYSRSITDEKIDRNVM